MSEQYEQPRQPKSQVPAQMVLKHLKDPFQDAWPGGGVPSGGEGIIPHIFTVAGRYGVASRVYSYGDESLVDSRENAEIMRNELAIMECLDARKRSTALLNWHIGPMDEGLDALTRERLKISGVNANTWDAEELAAKVSLILQRTPNLTKMFDSLMDAIWYGRYGTQQFFGATNIEGISNRTLYIKRWEPRHGDKLVFRYDDGTFQFDPQQIGIRIGPGYQIQKQMTGYAGNKYNKVEATQFGLAYFLDNNERQKMAVHKHVFEDGDFNHPIKAGAIHGVGIRSRIYWTWYAYSECLKLLMEYMERSALGIEIWRFPAHNPQAKADATEAAQRRGAPGRSILMVPVPEGENSDLYDVQIVEPGLQGADVLQNVLDRFFGHKIKRYILGQTLTTEADATGMGSGVADAHQATYADIVRYDSLGLAETITHDIVRVIQLLNFPGSEGIWLKFSFDTESPLMSQKLDAYRSAWEMGAAIKTEDIFKLLGASRPTEDEDRLQNPAFADPMLQMAMEPAVAQQEAMAQQQNMTMLGYGQPGMESEADPAGSQDMFSVYAAGQHSDEPLLSVESRYDSQGEPSDAQIKAGNAPLKHVNWQGLRISIENEKGSKRRGWDHVLTADYGYIRGSKSHDGDHLDVYLGPNLDSEIVFIVDQQTKAGRLDEWKCVIGCTSKREARHLYLAQYKKGWRTGPITALTVEQFKAFLKKQGLKKIQGRASTKKFSADSNKPKYSAEQIGAYEENHGRNATIARFDLSGSDCDPLKSNDSGTEIEIHDAINRLQKSSDYGTVYYNPDTRKAWIQLGDGDSNFDEWETAIKGISGIESVDGESEMAPKEWGKGSPWIAIKQNGKIEHDPIKSKYGAQGECDPNMTKDGKTTCEITKYSADSIAELAESEIERWTT